MATEGVLQPAAAGGELAFGGKAAAPWLRRLTDAATRPVDGSSVAAFRISFGLLLFLAVVRTFARGWVDAHFAEPRFFFPYYGFEWMRPWPHGGMTVHFVVMGVASLGVAAGAFVRLSSLVLFATFTYAHLVDQTYYLNHYHLVSCVAFLCMLLPLGDVWSVAGLRRGQRASGTVPAWVVWALRAQFGLVYFYAGLGKLGADWLLAGQPLRLWLGASADHPIFGPLGAVAFAGVALSWAAALFDLGVPFLLLGRRTRPLAFGALLVFHAATAELFRIGIFPWLMTLGALLFFDADWPRRAATRLRCLAGGLPVPAASPPGTPDESVRPQPLVASVLAIYFALQVLVPLRSHLYPGQVLWTEEGFRFSWRVMVMEKTGTIDFRVEDPGSGRSYVVAPGDYATPDQVRMMATQPDMILSLAHRIGRDFEARGVHEPRVYADAFVSLNGRRAVRFVDREVDLHREEEGFHAKGWILPAPEGSPP